MSKIGVSLKIDVSKIDKQLLFKGQKGTYLDAKVFIDIDQKDQYDNNGMITQELGKNAQQGDKGNILGNCKVFWNEAGAPQQQAPQQQQRPMTQAIQQNVRQNVQQNQQQPPQFQEDQNIPF